MKESKTKTELSLTERFYQLSDIYAGISGTDLQERCQEASQNTIWGMLPNSAWLRSSCAIQGALVRLRVFHAAYSIYRIDHHRMEWPQ